jgi:hypothetical protein
MVLDMENTHANSGDAVALAVDNPPKHKWDGWPWPYADRQASYKPGKFTPRPLDPQPEPMWPYYLAAVLTLCGVAFVICAFWWKG